MATTPLRVLVTGAGRGIGHHLARTYIERGDRVWGSGRAGRTAELADLHPEGIIEFDLADEAGIMAGMDRLAEHLDGLDLLINCAGIDARAIGAPDGRRGPFDLDADTLSAVVRVNVAGPMVVTREALPLLRGGDGPVVANISSQLGSMTFARGAGRDTAYCVSKAALNMLSVKSAAALEAEAVAVVMLHPGWVSTDMGGTAAPLTPSESAAAIQRTLDAVTLQDTGRFLTWDGRDHAW